MNRSPRAVKPPRFNTYLAFALLTFTAVVLRAEVALFLAPLALQYLVYGGISIIDLIKVGGLAALLSVGTSSIERYVVSHYGSDQLF